MMRQAQAIFRKKGAAIGIPKQGVRAPPAKSALHGAEADLPISYSFHDFFLIRLHHRQAGPISIFQ
jgi:hypothetical protein